MIIRPSQTLSIFDTFLLNALSFQTPPHSVNIHAYRYPKYIHTYRYPHARWNAGGVSKLLTVLEFYVTKTRYISYPIFEPITKEDIITDLDLITKFKEVSPAYLYAVSYLSEISLIVTPSPVRTPGV